MTYEDELREEHQHKLDRRDDERLDSAIAYTERDNANLHRAVERLEKKNAALVELLLSKAEALEVFFKVVVVDGKQYRPGYPLCAGCEELTIARGMECFYKKQTPECKYPDEIIKEALAQAGDA